MLPPSSPSNSGRSARGWILGIETNEAPTIPGTTRERAEATAEIPKPSLCYATWYGEGSAASGGGEAVFTLSNTTTGSCLKTGSHLAATCSSTRGARRARGDGARTFLSALARWSTPKPTGGQEWAQDRILREQGSNQGRAEVGGGRRQGRHSYQPRATPWVHQPKTPSALKARFILRPASRQPATRRQSQTYLSSNATWYFCNKFRYSSWNVRVR